MIIPEQLKIISVGNPSRLVKTARKRFRENDEALYRFNTETGEFVNYEMYNKDQILAGFTFLSDDFYPLFKNNKFVGVFVQGLIFEPFNLHSRS